jgi:hypothetical protein
MYNIQARVGRVDIRVGGGFIDTATLVSSLGSSQSVAVLYGSAVPVSSPND